MNKKFLSAILFGALMATSAGTFVSCKDYDDDIENLQGQIDKNSSAIAELQKLVGAGNWVTSISPVTGGFTVTMSNGQSQTITGINGADGKDGKNGTEWTIGEDGFWYMDGEKTDNVAIGKNGENGVTAPSPTIGADGNWVVYNWDAEKGEFVAEATEIPAQGTAAYAVEANGVITLHIADANGEYMEIALPSTCDSFVVSAPADVHVKVAVEEAKWNPSTSNKLYKKLAAEFPEIAELTKGEKLTQGGELPLLVNPTALELDETFSFSLVDVKGKVADIELSNPTKGIAADWNINLDDMSRSADVQAGLWTLNVTPAYDKKKGYASISNGALIATNAKGVSSRTTFSYDVYTNEVGKVEIGSDTQEAEYAEVIDVLAANKDNKAIFTLTNEYYGKYILEATNAVQREKYGVEIDGSELTVEMPANTMEITVTLKMTALGLNGSVAEETIDLKIKQSVDATASLSEKTVTLGTKAQKVRWNVEELGMSALQFDNLMSTGDVKIAVTREADKLPVGNLDDEVENYFTHYADIQFYNEKGNETNYTASSDSWSDGEGVTFGFDVDAMAAATAATLSGHTAEKWTEAVYTVTLTSKSGSTVVYAAETELTVENPVLGATYVKLVPGFVDANGVYQVTGKPETLSATSVLQPVANVVTYALEDALILGTGATIKEIIDLDYVTYKEEGREDEALDMHNFIRTKHGVETWILTVNQWAYDWETLTPVWRSDYYNQLYQTRNIRAMISLFNNPENVVPFDFQVEVKSELYTEIPADAITFDATKLVGVFGAKNADGTLASIDIKAAITKALVQAGTDKGKTYQLFATSKATSTGGSSAVINLASPKKAGSYVLGTDGNIVELSLVEYLQMIDAFGTSLQDANHANIITGDAKYKLTTDAWNKIWTVAANYYTTAGNAKYAEKYQYEDDGVTIKTDDNGNPLTETWKVDVNGTATPIFQYTYVQNGSVANAAATEFVTTDKEEMAIYAAFKSKISFNNTSDAVAGTPGTAVDKNRDPRVASVTIKFNEPAVAAIYFSGVTDGVVFTAAGATAQSYADAKITPVTEAPNSVTGGQVKVGLTLTIRDAWGMIMNVPFEVTVKTSAN